MKAEGKQREDVLGAEVGQGEVREALRDAAEFAADGFDGEMEDGDRGGREQERDDGAGQAFGDAWPEKDDGERGCGDGYGLPVHSAGVVKKEFDAREEFAGDGRCGEAEEVLDLRGGDEQRDAVGESDGDRARDEFDGGAEAGEAHDEEENAGHDSYEGQSGYAELDDDSGDDDDEGAGGAADLRA